VLSVYIIPAYINNIIPRVIATDISKIDEVLGPTTFDFVIWCDFDSRESSMILILKSLFSVSSNS